MASLTLLQGGLRVWVGAACLTQHPAMHAGSSALHHSCRQATIFCTHVQAPFACGLWVLLSCWCLYVNHSCVYGMWSAAVARPVGCCEHTSCDRGLSDHSGCTYNCVCAVASPWHTWTLALTGTVVRSKPKRLVL
jgi:hypothetical protein